MNRNAQCIILLALLVVSPSAYSQERNPDVPFGGIALDLGFAYSNEVPEAAFYNYDSWDAGSTNRDNYVKRFIGDKVYTYSALVLFPVSAKVTGRAGVQYSESIFTETSSRNYGFDYTESQHKGYVGTYSFGVKLYLFGSSD